MKAAASKVFPDSQQQICIFHIIKNVLINAKKKYRRTNQETNSDDEEYAEAEE